MRPDDVCSEYAESGVKIKIAELNDTTILIQGNREALRFMAKLFSAQAESDDDGFCISPHEAGKAWFARGSTKGIYISRLGK